MTDLQGQIDGKYEILAKIREGGMGTVYKVRHLLLDEIRVAKVIHPHLDDDPEVRARFLREARAASRLRHPNIAQLFDFMVDPAGDQFLVLEYIDGLTLRDLLRRHGPPSLGLAVEIARQSLAALGYLHRRGFVHRDIAPDNLMLTRGPDGGPLVKLIDLGIAKGPRPSDHGLTGSGIFMGKPRPPPPKDPPPRPPLPSALPPSGRGGALPTSSCSSFWVAAPSPGRTGVRVGEGRGEGLWAGEDSNAR